MRRGLIPAALLIASLAAGGAAGWHLNQPTRAEAETREATKILESFPSVVPSQSVTIRPETRARSGAKFGVIRIPKIKLNFPLVEGTSDKDLMRGAGRYDKTALPGEIGNLGLAGHVNGEVDPFRHIGKLKAGDLILIDTKVASYTYKVIERTDCGKTQMDVHETKIEVLNPVPCSEASPQEALLTLTTCSYPYGTKPPATYRKIVWAVLDKTQAR